MERRKELEREAEREPLGEIVSRLREPPPPADDREQVEERLHGERGAEAGRRGYVRRCGQRRQRAAVGAKEQPDGGERHRRRQHRVAERTVADAAATADERCGRDEALARDAACERRPGVRAVEGSAVERGDDGEGDSRWT